MRRSLLTCFASALCALLGPSDAEANKFDAGFGYYTISATRAGQSATLSNLGLFYIGYRRAVVDRIELGVSYGILYSKSVGSDAGYGIDVFGSYYPFTSVNNYDWSEGNVTIEMYDRWKPYVRAGLQQRSFQSAVSTNTVSYLGYGFGAGVERTLTRKLSLKTELTYYFLHGPSETSATELDIKTGMAFRF